MKHNDGLDEWLTAMRHEMERACELPEKVMLGDDLPDDLPQDGGGLGTWHWLGFDALKIKNPEVMILGKESSIRPCGATSPAAAEEERDFVWVGLGALREVRGAVIVTKQEPPRDGRLF